MITSNILRTGSRAAGERHSAKGWIVPAFFLVAISGCYTAILTSQELATDELTPQVLTRGPVHEAFAGVISFESLPGIIIAHAPPAAIEEIPPGERPEGDFVTWIPGYWADVRVAETTYLPEPPQTVEEGPNIAAPAADYGWTPGNWMWHRDRYAWSPGYWAQGRADWVWVPAHYVWTRRGYVFVDGFWDHTVQRRGVLFAPVYFDRRVYSRPH